MHEASHSNMALHFFHTLETLDSKQEKVILNLVLIYKLRPAFILLILAMGRLCGTKIGKLP